MDEYPAAGHQPAFKAPGPALALVAALLAAYVVQRLLGAEAMIRIYGFAPSDLAEGRPLTLVTSQFLHGGWLHVGMNAIWALALAPPVSRFLGTRPGGAVTLWLLFLICGAAGCLAFALVHWGQGGVILVGASGGVAGLMGGASRLFRPGGPPAALTDRGVVAMGASWLGVNLVLALLGGTAMLEGAVMGWEAHIAGYLVGLLLLRPAGGAAAWIDGQVARLRP